jgi:hypothetical protein
MPPFSLVDMTELDKFIDIFGGSFSAYGQTKKTEEFDDRGKHKTKSFIIKQVPSTQMFQDHLNGKDPALGIIPINEQNKCRWACIDIDVYNGFDHKKLIQEITENKFPLTVFRSKSGGAHVFLFTKKFEPAALFRAKLKDMAAVLGYANAEIFPKQNQVDMNKGGTGSFLNLPYHNVKMTLRYAMKEDATAMTLKEFFDWYDKTALETLEDLEVKQPKEEDVLKGAPPCLIMLAKKGIPNGKRNNAMYNFGVYCKKRFTDWKQRIVVYNLTYCKPPLEEKEMEVLKKSIENKEYQYKCKDEPIASFCNSKKCVLQEYGVGDDEVPGVEIKEIQKYDSDPPLFYVTIGDKQVEVDSSELHDADKFSLKCLEQINQAMPPVGKHIWRKAINKLLKDVIPQDAPESTKIDVQLKELLTDYTSKAPGKDWKDILRGLSFTEDGMTYFKFKDFWRYILRSKQWPDKQYPKQKTSKMLETMFKAKEVVGKINNKGVRYMRISQLDINKPIVRKEKMKRAPFE